MEIRKINKADASTTENIVSIHLTVLTESFLNNFGRKFLETIYVNIINSQESICLALYENDKIEGFALATKDYSTFFSNAIRENRFILFWELSTNLLLKPLNIYKLLKSLPNMVFTKEIPHAELQFLGVSPEFQGKGFGSALIERLGEEFKKVGVSEFYVGTKAEDPLSNKFYQKIGFAKKYSKTYFDKELNYYLSPRL